VTPFLYLTIRTPDRHHIDRRQFAGSEPSPTLSIADVRVALLAGHPRCGGRGLTNLTTIKALALATVYFVRQ
jgi:hypothetical protein